MAGHCLIFINEAKGKVKVTSNLLAQSTGCNPVVIRNVFSVNCDTDTIGCIAGGIADAFYGGTGYDEDALLRRYLIKPNEYGRLDTFLYDWAKMPD